MIINEVIKVKPGAIDYNDDSTSINSMDEDSAEVKNNYNHVLEAI